jgi:Dolichyl-phosphate-mannose-protein mannosyltransferase
VLRKPAVHAAGVFLVALIARLLYLRWRGPHATADTDQYFLIARNLLRHAAYSLSTAEPFLPTIRRPPLYPFFIALLGVPSFAVMGLVQSIINAATALLVLFLARTTLPPRYALGAALAYGLHPGAIAVTVWMLSETLYTAMLATALALMAWAIRRDSLARSAAGGLFLGLAVLNRPIAFLLPVAYFAILVVMPHVRRRAAHSAVTIAAALLVVVPWTIRCTRVSHSVVLVQGCLAVNAYVAARYDWSDLGDTERAVRLTTETECGRPLAGITQGGDLTPEEQVENDRVCGRATWEIVRAHPVAYLKNQLRNYPHLFLQSYDMFTGVSNRMAANSWSRVLANHAYGLMLVKGLMLVVFSLLPLALAFISLPASRRDPAAAMAALAWIYCMIVHFPLYIEARFWMPSVPFLMFSAAIGAQVLFRRFFHAPAPVASAGGLEVLPGH